MQDWQKYLLLAYFLFSLFGFIIGIDQSRRGNSYKKPKWGIYNLIGAFVWADTVVFGLFWLMTSLVVYFLEDWLLFLLILSVFWSVRAWGESVYWFNQQFSTLRKNSPKDIWFYQIFKNDSVWFVYQIFWQCILVLAVVASIYLAKVWL